jgi:hypothetical protein
MKESTAALDDQDLVRFRVWLHETTAYTPACVTDITSRVRRASRLIGPLLAQSDTEFSESFRQVAQGGSPLLFGVSSNEARFAFVSAL